jgi:hypothetical protein
MFFNRLPNHFRQRAASVVSECGVLAAGLSLPMGRAFPDTLTIPLPHWNRVVTVASVCHAIALTETLSISAHLREELIGIVVQHLGAEDPSNVEALMSLTRCVNAEVARLKTIPELAEDMELLRNTAFGTCVAFALMKKMPDGDEGFALVAALGHAICEQTMGVWGS